MECLKMAFEDCIVQIFLAIFLSYYLPAIYHVKRNDFDLNTIVREGNTSSSSH